jgi:menaquinone-dependent protoporphyrinogen oxidase
MKILVAYVTKRGSTREVAQKIGEVLTSKGMEVKVSNIKDKPDPEGFDAAVVGAPVMMGSLLHRAPRFVKKHLKILGQIPVAWFSLGVTMKEDTEANRATMMKSLNPVISKITPVAIGLFGGKYKDEDYRDWKKIEAWAERLVEKLK